MYIKSDRYEQIARRGVRWAVESALMIKAAGKTPAPISSNIPNIIGYALTDAEEKDFSRYNERKATRFVLSEIRAWKAGWRVL